MIPLSESELIEDFIVPGPVHDDCCGHPKDSYVCSFRYTWIHGEKEYSKVFDFYLYPGHEGSMDLCLRDGNEPGNYASPGELFSFLLRQDSRNEWPPHYYKIAASILKHMGALTWTRNPHKLKRKEP